MKKNGVFGELMKFAYKMIDSIDFYTFKSCLEVFPGIHNYIKPKGLFAMQNILIKFELVLVRLGPKRVLHTNQNRTFVKVCRFRALSA